MIGRRRQEASHDILLEGAEDQEGCFHERATERANNGDAEDMSVKCRITLLLVYSTALCSREFITKAFCTVCTIGQLR